MDFFEFVEKIYNLTFCEYYFEITESQRSAIRCDYKNRGYKGRMGY